MTVLARDVYHVLLSRATLFEVIMEQKFIGTARWKVEGDRRWPFHSFPRPKRQEYPPIGGYGEDI